MVSDVRTCRAAVLGLLLAACTPASTPPDAPVTVANVADSTSTSPRSLPRQPRAEGILRIDGADLGSPVGVLLARAPYDQPCDVDTIEERRSTLFFWAAGPCRDAPAFPGGTSLVIVTPHTEGGARSEQPITLVAWAGGPYFDAKTNLPIHIGDSTDRALELLGEPAATKQNIQQRSGQPTESTTLSWGRVHALMRANAVVALAIGDLDIRAEGERGETLERLYQHHLRYAQRVR